MLIRNAFAHPMWRKLLINSSLRQPLWRRMSLRRSTTSMSSIVDSMLLRSLRDHYVEVTKMNPPPKVSPPAEFTILKGALDGNGPVLTRTFGNEEINISVMRLILVEDDDDDVDQLFIHVDVSKPGQEKSTHFLCELYKEAIGIRSVSLRQKADNPESPTTYNGPLFGELDEEMRDALHNYIEERGVNEGLFKFLQAWLYVKDNQSLLRWYKSVGMFIKGNKSSEDDKQSVINVRS